MSPTLQHNIQTEAKQQFASLPLPGAPDEAWRRVPLHTLYPLLDIEKGTSQLKLGRVEVRSGQRELPALKSGAQEDAQILQRWSQLEDLRQQHRLERANDVELNKLFAFPLMHSNLVHVLEITPESESRIRLDIHLHSDESPSVSAPLYYLPVLVLHAHAHSSASVELHLHTNDQQRSAVMLARTIIMLDEGASIDLYDARAGAEAPALTGGFFLEHTYLGENAALKIGRETGRYETGMHDTRYALQGRGAQLAEYTLMQAGGERFSGQKTVVEQYGAHTSSEVETRSILSDKAHGSFVGTIKIPQGARGASGHETHRSLLLSPGSRIESLPELEIVENEVSCSHGSTVTELDAEARHYLESRGISQEETRELLTAAFSDHLKARMPGAQPELDALHYYTDENVEETTKEDNQSE